MLVTYDLHCSNTLATPQACCSHAQQHVSGRPTCHRHQAVSHDDAADLDAVSWHRVLRAASGISETGTLTRGCLEGAQECELCFAAKGQVR